MTSEEKSYRGCFMTIVCCILMSIALNLYFIWRGEPQPSVVVERDTVWKDTIIYKPVPVDSHKTGEIVYIRIPYPVPAPGDTIHDSIEVPIPIEQKRYEDSLYTAWVSGYQPALDSIQLHQPTIVETVTRTIVKPAPRWSIGPSVGAGISITGTPRLGVYAGFTVQYRLWPK